MPTILLRPGFASSIPSHCGMSGFHTKSPDYAGRSFPLGRQSPRAGTVVLPRTSRSWNTGFALSHQEACTTIPSHCNRWLDPDNRLVRLRSRKNRHSTHSSRWGRLSRHDFRRFRSDYRWHPCGGHSRNIPVRWCRRVRRNLRNTSQLSRCTAWYHIGLCLGERLSLALPTTARRYPDTRELTVRLRRRNLPRDAIALGALGRAAKQKVPRSEQIPEPKEALAGIASRMSLPHTLQQRGMPRQQHPASGASPWPILDPTAIWSQRSC
jgi:hypothetical protein